MLIDGQPVTTGTIRLVPDAGHAATGELDASGRFKLTTYKENDGALPGKFQVEVVAIENKGNQSRSLIPRKYSDMATSGLQTEVKEATKDLKIELTWGGETPEVAQGGVDNGDRVP